MDLPGGLPAPSDRAVRLYEEMLAFVRDHVLPAEREYLAARHAPGGPHYDVPPVVERLKQVARSKGLWNLFLPARSGLTQLEYAPIAELSGWSHDLAPEAINGQAPDSGTMELLHLVADPDQQDRYLEPLLEGRIRSAFAMTEPGVASSDATNIATRIEPDGDGFLLTGHKWWTSGALDPRCAFFVVLGRSADDGPAHRRHTMVLVPRDAPGVRVLRDHSVFGHHDRHGHPEVVFDRVKVPASDLLGEVGGGFAAAQARLGPGRIHHCMRAIGAAERALALTVDRARHRSAFGSTLADMPVVREQVARSRVEIEQARLLCHRAAHAIDAQGAKAARDLVAMAKVVVPQTVAVVIDRAIQVHGGAGVSDATPLAEMYAWHRAMRLFDGPDEVHLRAIGAAELRREPVLPPTPYPTPTEMLEQA